MKKIILMLVIVLFIFSCEEDNPVTTDLSSKFIKIQNMLDTAFRGYLTRQSIPDTGDISFYMSYKGTKHFFHSGFDKSINENYHFRIASNTKVFTSAAIMLLYQQGKLNIDDKIVDLIPNTSEPYVPNTSNFDIPFKNNITIRQLMQHRAGVFDVTNSDIPDTVNMPYAGKNYLEWAKNTYGITHQFTFDELLGVVSETQLYYFEPGTDFHYSNTGYNLMAVIIERISGIKYSDFVTENLINNNNLLSTSCPWEATDNKLPEPFMRGYIYSNGIFEDATESNMSGNVSEGNIISTPADMIKWIKLMITGNAGINKENVEIMIDNPDIYIKHYGLGIITTESVGYGHNGAHDGYLSFVFYNPDMDLAVCIVWTLWDLSEGLDSISNQLMILQDLLKESVIILKE
ncbi:serine hydrolase domain-containing protein [Bacteroidota bacterium]